MSTLSQQVHDRAGSRPDSKLPDALGKALLLVLSLSLSILGAEMATRLVYGHFLGKWGERAEFFSYDSLLGWRGRRNVEAQFQRTDFSVTVRQNRYGHPGVEYPVGKPLGKWRILLLGDSYTWGYGLDQDKTFAALLDEQLPATQIINMGCSGFGTDQELLALETDGLRFSPDVVIVVVSLPSDFHNNTHSVQYSYPKPYFVIATGSLERRNVPVPHRNLAQRVSCYLTRRSALYNYIRARRIRLPFRKDVPQGESGAEEVIITAELLKEIDRLCSAHGATTLIVLNPTITAKTYRMYGSDKMDRLDMLLRDAHLPVLNLSHAFSDHVRTSSDRIIFQHDSHWNEVGHQLVAATIQEALAQQGLLGPATDP